MKRTVINIKHLGDILSIDGAEIPVVDIITGGSPCQDLSVAGKRAGLEGERSGLFMEQVRIVKEMREHDRATGRSVEFLRPRYLIWENVPGSLSSPGKRNGEDHRGEDFQAVLTEIIKIVCKDAPDVPLPDKRKWEKAGYLTGVGDDGIPFSIAYRVHDAQFWNVPQRRKRICVLADFNGLTAGQILLDPKFERVSEGREEHNPVGHPDRGCRSEVRTVSKSLSGNPQPGEQKGETVAGDFEESLGESNQPGQ